MVCMDIYSLATYTTERYYLLSELEQRATFIFLDEPVSDSSEENEQNEQNKQKEQKDGDQETTDSRGILMKARTKAKNIYYYVLWKYRDGLEALLKQLKQFKIAMSSRNDSRKEEDKADHLKEWLCIECYIAASEQRDLVNTSQETGFDAKVISDLNTWVEENLPFMNVTILGMSSSLIGTPAIECVFDQIFYEHPAPSMTFAQEQQIIVSLYRVDCLGHDPAHEPDADSGVIQFLFTSTNYFRPEVVPTKTMSGGQNEFFMTVTTATVVFLIAIIVIQFLHPSFIEEMAMMTYLLMGSIKETKSE